MANKNDEILTEIKESLNPMEAIVLESMLQGDNIKETADNCAISIAHAQSYRKTIYDIVGNHVDLSNKKTRQNDLIVFFNRLTEEAVPGTVHNFVEKNSELDSKIEESAANDSKSPFDDPYFKNLSMEAIAELAKKSIRLGAENSELEEQIEAKNLALESKQEMLVEIDKALNEAQSEIKKLQEGIMLQKGNFFVFNPKKGQPHRVYKDYASAYLDGKDVSKKEQNPVYILKLLTLIVPKCSFETIDISTKGISENYVDDVIPF